MLRFIGLISLLLLCLLSSGSEALAQTSSNTWDFVYFEDDPEGLISFIQELPDNCKLDVNILGSSVSIGATVFYACPNKQSKTNWQVEVFEDEVEPAVTFIRTLDRSCNVDIVFLTDSVNFYGTIVSYACPGSGSDI